MKNLLKLSTPVVVALAFLVAGTSSLASDTGTFSVERALTKLQSDVTTLTTKLATLQSDVTKLQSEFASRGQVAILHAIPQKIADGGNHNAATYQVLGNTIDGAFFKVGDNNQLTDDESQFGDSGLTGALTLPDGVYLIELMQPKLPSAIDSSGLTATTIANYASTVADYAECEPVATHHTKWFATSADSGTGYLPNKCYPAKLFFNAPQGHGTLTRFRVEGGFIYSFVSGVSFTVRFNLRPNMVVTDVRTYESYAAILKITRL